MLSETSEWPHWDLISESLLMLRPITSVETCRPQISNKQTSEETQTPAICCSRHAVLLSFFAVTTSPFPLCPPSASQTLQSFNSIIAVEANSCGIVYQDWKCFPLNTIKTRGKNAAEQTQSPAYSPSGAGCSQESEPGTSAGRLPSPPPAAACSQGLGAGGGDLGARAAGWPVGSGRSC